jgi:hypothetical protein
MPPVAAAVLPHPPLLVRELAGGAAAELDPLRSACRAALAAVLAVADLTVVVGDGPVWGVPDPGATGSFRPYGADVEVELPGLAALDLAGLPEPARLAGLPLSLAVAAALLVDLDPGPSQLFAATVPASLGPGAAASVGHTLAASTARSAGEDEGARVGLVAMGDLSACRSELAPGAFRQEAARFDASVAQAFRDGAPARLLELDPGPSTELLAAGRVPLQVLAGAFDPGPPPSGRDTAGAFGQGPEPGLRGRVLYEDAPYGVGYLVALLTAT